MVTNYGGQHFTEGNIGTSLEGVATDPAAGAAAIGATGYNTALELGKLDTVRCREAIRDGRLFHGD